MALVEGCKYQFEISVPVDEVARESERVVDSLARKVKLPGFRPGKVPPHIIRTRFASDVQQEVIESLVPRYFMDKVKEEHLQVVGKPTFKDVHFHSGEPLVFKAEFEVTPAFDLGEYLDIEVPYQEPSVSDEDIEKRLGEIQERKAEYVSVDARPLEDGDFALVSLHSIAGVEGKPIEQEELRLQIGGESTMAPFNDGLRGAEPGQEKEIEVDYPAEYGEQSLAGRRVKFRIAVKAVERKELPELNDEFAQDLGDYKDMDEVRDAIRKSIYGEREHAAQHAAKEALIDKLVAGHDFPVPEAYIDQQIETRVESQLRELAMEGIDPRSLKLDWEKVKESQRDRAIHDVRAALLLDKIADREAIATTNDEVDRELQRIARREREPVAALRMRLEKDGTLARIASRIRTDKTLAWLFEKARKVAPESIPAAAPEPEPGEGQ
ncbi:MAG: trigger factor [Bryobacterales bacterium]|nr:trigger factor [Bryobacterales bacterium]